VRDKPRHSWLGYLTSVKTHTRIGSFTADTLGFWEQRGYHNHADPWTEERFS